MVGRYLRNLTTRRAACLFLIGLVTGAGLIYMEFGVPWSPAAVVLALSAVLLVSAVKFRVSHSELTNSSPYFLGFIFFLISVYHAFIMGEGLETRTAGTQLGAALLSTIVGLPLRHILFAYSPGQEDQDLFFRSLEEELRRSATEFKRSQAELVDLVREFSRTRQRLFASEERASAKYVSNLEKAIGLFDQHIDAYPNIITSAVEKCAEITNVLRRNIVSLNEASEAIKPKLFEQLQQSLESLTAALTYIRPPANQLQTTVESLQIAASNLSGTVTQELLKMKTQAGETQREMSLKVTAIQADLDAVDDLLTEFVTLTREKMHDFR